MNTATKHSTLRMLSLWRIDAGDIWAIGKLGVND
jgi:hypothetical protein